MGHRSQGCKLSYADAGQMQQLLAEELGKTRSELEAGGSGVVAMYKAANEGVGQGWTAGARLLFLTV